MAWIVASLRRLRDERMSALGLAAIVLVTAFLAAATPRLLDRAADETLRSTLLGARAEARNIQFIREERIEAFGDDPFALVLAEADEVHELLPPSVAALVVDRAWTMDSGRFRIPNIGEDHATMRLRIQADAATRIHLVAGRWPTGATGEVPNPAPEPVPARLTQFEVALSEETAAAIRNEVGDTLILTSDSRDQLVGAGHELAVGVEIVGIFAVDDDADPWWLGTTELARPPLRTEGDLLIPDTTALLAPEAYPAWMAETRELFMPSRYTFREYLDVDRFDSSAVGPLLVDLRRLEAAYSSTRVTVNQQVAMRTGLRAILDGYRGQWSSATAILTIGAIGPAAVAAGALGLIAVLAARRRRAALALARGRGASLGQVVTAVVAEGIVLGGPVAALAIAGALVLVPADPLAMSLAAGIAVAVVAVVLLVITTVPATGGSSFGSVREAFVPRRPTARRVLFEALVVGLAVAGAVLLRERGVRGTSSAGGLAEADPLLAAVPALVGVAAALVVVRLLPYPMRLLAALARRRRDLVPVLAMRRATQGTGLAPILVVLMTTAAIGTFSSAVLVHLDRAAETVAWGEVGAAYRIDEHSGSISTRFDPDALPGVEASAAVWARSMAVGDRNLRIEVVALDVADYDAVTAGTPADPHLPLDLYGSAPQVIPLVASRALAERPDGMAPGTELRMTVQGYSFPARVVATRDDLPGLVSESLFLIVSRDQIKALYPTVPLAPTSIFLRAPVDADEAIRAAVRAQLPPETPVISRAAQTAALRTSPISRAVESGIALAAIIAISYAALAVAASLALAGAARAVEVAHLRTMGLTGRQAAGLVVVEHGPGVLLAFALGTALGLGIFLGIRDGLGLELLVGSRVAVPITIEPAQLLVVLGVIVAVIGGGLGIGTLMQRGAVPAAAVRRGFE
jgi:putative ABC transport system permease protein